MMKHADHPVMKANAVCQNCGKEWKTQNTPEQYCSLVCRFDARQKQ